MRPSRPAQSGPVMLRRFRPQDSPATYTVFYRAVHEGADAHYTALQRQAWAASSVPPLNWTDRLGTQKTWVATKEHRIVGFMSLLDNGHLDMAFVVPEMMGTGVAAKLYAKIEIDARALGLTTLTTQASHLARSFFERQSWSVISDKTVSRLNQRIEVFEMSKTL